MPRNFNRPLSGLLGYLDQKSDGRNPGFLSEFTQGTVDLDIWLRSQPEPFATNLPPLAGAGTSVVASGDIVPEGEAWLLWDTTFSLGWAGIAPVAGNYAAIQVCHVTPSAIVYLPISPVDRLFYGGSAGPQLTFNGVCAFRAEPFILRAGEQVGAITHNFFPVGMSVTPRTTYKRIRFPA